MCHTLKEGDLTGLQVSAPSRQGKGRLNPPLLDYDGQNQQQITSFIEACISFILASIGYTFPCCIVFHHIMNIPKKIETETARRGLTSAEL